MDVHNFQLSDIFQQNAKEYVTRPIKAMKYQHGLGVVGQIEAVKNLVSMNFRLS